MKICKICRERFPATEEYFHKHPKTKDLLDHRCKQCKREEDKKYKEANREKIREYQKEYTAGMRESDYGPRLQFLKNIHKWVKRNKPKQDYCSICNEEKKLELANISGEYKKDIADYWYLCRECHVLFDKTNNTHKNDTHKRSYKRGYDP